jgi:hypothetical protein
LASEDHTIGMKFSEPSQSASDGVAYLKVCVKDWRAHALAQRRSDGIQTVTDAEGIKTVYCSQAVLETLQEINSAGTLSERKPRLAGLWGLDGKQYACIGTLSSGKDGVLSADLILALPFQETDKIPPGSTGYQGTKCTCRGKEFILAGREIEALPQPRSSGKSEFDKAEIMKVTEFNKAETECTAESCPIDKEKLLLAHEKVGKDIPYTDTITITPKMGKKIKEPKAQPTIQRKAVETEKGIDNNETKTKTVSSPALPNVALSPAGEAKTSELAELQANDKNKEKPRAAGKKIRAGASPLK